MDKKFVSNRYDFVYLFDVIDGNPNGDPDGGNSPRTDLETGHGLVTDVCLKRKVRNFVEIAVASGECPAEGNELFIREKAILNQLITEEVNKVESKEKDIVASARERMCLRYYDVRTFGAVMAMGEKGKNAGQVRGPIQFTFGRSIDPIFPSEHTITRMAVATEKESEKQAGDNRTMGRKSTVPYALYRAHGFITPHLAKDTGFDESDLELFWKALGGMFDLDRSAARGLMSARRLIVFKHRSMLGNAPAHKLLELVQVKPRNPEMPARSFYDYEVTIGKLPDGIELIELI